MSSIDDLYSYALAGSETLALIEKLEQEDQKNRDDLVDAMKKIGAKTEFYADGHAYFTFEGPLPLGWEMQQTKPAEYYSLSTTYAGDPTFQQLKELAAAYDADRTDIKAKIRLTAFVIQCKSNVDIQFNHDGEASYSKVEPRFTGISHMWETGDAVHFRSDYTKDYIFEQADQWLEKKSRPLVETAVPKSTWFAPPEIVEATKDARKAIFLYDALRGADTCFKNYGIRTKFNRACKDAIGDPSENISFSFEKVAGKTVVVRPGKANAFWFPPDCQQISNNDYAALKNKPRF